MIIYYVIKDKYLIKKSYLLKIIQVSCTHILNVVPTMIKCNTMVICGIYTIKNNTLMIKGKTFDLKIA